MVGTRDARAVFVVRSGKAERHPVRIGQASGEVVEILEGLDVGDSVVVAGAENLRDGADIRIVPPIAAVVRTQ